MTKTISLSLLFLCTLLLGACASQSTAPKLASETRECMRYHSMMTAPMAPHAMEQLKKACDDSRERQQTD